MSLIPIYTTNLGSLYTGDCLEILPNIEKESIDTVFADPPFSIGKEYGPNYKDNMPDTDYLAWCRQWLEECVRILKPGGALFLYNIPKWNMQLGAHLVNKLDFRHWIAIEQKNGMPISGRLFPSHYSLLYFTKGKPNTFHKIRTPIEICRHCDKEIPDYGGHRRAIHPDGINLKDVWTDITPVRHKKYMVEGRRANALSSKILDRVIEMSTNKGDLVLDPFGGSGTTFAVCEAKNRKWIGIELDFCDAIISRLQGGVELHPNQDRVEITSL